MKKTDLEKFKGKKLDIRKSQESAFGKHSKSSAHNLKAAQPHAPPSLMSRLLDKVIDNQ